MSNLIDFLHSYRLVLASGSPRRRHLLSELGLSFDVLTPAVDEDYPEELRAHEIALFLAEKKANAAKALMEVDNYLIVAADTIVWINNGVLSKPAGRDDAKRILAALSGNTHEVITGMCLLSHNRKELFYENTKVCFRDLTEQEIGFYIDRYKPYDKAGAYGIQEWIGLTGVTRVDGCFFNVMGLPAQRLYRELHDFVTK